jgi:hypothetical protein
VIPGTGNETLDLILQIAIVGVLLVSVVLLIKNLRGR